MFLLNKFKVQKSKQQIKIDNEALILSEAKDPAAVVGRSFGLRPRDDPMGHFDV